MTRPLEERIERALVPDEPNVDEEIIWRDENPEKPPRFVVDAADKADWALRKLAAIDKRMTDNDAQAERIIGQAEAWLREVNAQELKHTEFFRGLLAEYHLAQLREDPKRKTIKLPAGTLVSRQSPASLDVDVEKFLTWFDSDPYHGAEFPDVVRVKREPDKNAIKQTFEARDDGSLWHRETGEIVDGATLMEGGIKFVVKTEVAPNRVLTTEQEETE